MRRLTQYIHELPEWPEFHWNKERLSEILSDVRHKQGLLLGRMQSLGFPLQQEAVLETLTTDVLKSSEIEGEKLNPEHVRSSVARRLGMDIGGLQPVDRSVEGVVEMMLDATRNYATALTSERLFAWHAALFPTGRSGMTKIKVGAWRDDNKGPMQVVSGPMGRERVHYEAPSATKLPQDTERFLTWFEGANESSWVLKAAIAHLWFVTIHPFDDGNGRIARAIADMALARSENSPQRFYSMSAQIRQERAMYYQELERTQKGSLDITSWMDWFLRCLGRAIEGAQKTLSSVLEEGRFWQSIVGIPLNDRQRRVLAMLLRGFEGKLTTSKWAAITKSSHDTANRDIQVLLEHGILVRNPGGGRSTSFSLVMPAQA